MRLYHTSALNSSDTYSFESFRRETKDELQCTLPLNVFEAVPNNPPNAGVSFRYLRQR
jgi:hypothetical protein